MNLAQLQPANTQKAKTLAQNVFKRFLHDQHVQMEDVATAVQGDPTGSILVSLLDRFGVHLAFQEGKKGEKLAHTTVMQYFRQAKLWLLDCFPQSSAHVEAALLKKGGLLDRYCKTRAEGTVVKQATACSKEDLYLLMSYLYSSACSGSDYQDVALLALLWYLFGRASDLTLLKKQNLSMSGANVLFLRFVRVKTSQENGLSIFPDACVLTCPITAIAAALAMQTTPSASLLPHLPAPTSADLAELGPLVPLSDVLAGTVTELNLLEPSTESDNVATPKKKPTAPGIHGYVNRLLAKIAKRRVVSTLTSHSFRRGGAQTANGCPDLTLQWIADRGGWSLSSTNKAFQYIFNTTQEDQKVAKVLSGWDPKAAVPVATLAGFDSLTRVKLDAVKARLFACCSELQTTTHNVNPVVTDMLCAHLIKAFPELSQKNRKSPLVARVEEAIASADVVYEELLTWAVHLAQHVSISEVAEAKLDSKEAELLKAQAAVIEELLGLTKTLSKRSKDVEALLEGPAKRKAPAVELQAEPDKTPKPKKARKAASTNLVDTWYEWYACRMHSRGDVDSKKKSDARNVVAFMNLFAGEFALDEAAQDFRDQVLSLATQIAGHVHAFFDEHSVRARSTGTALKAFRQLHRARKLNGLIVDYTLRVRAGLVVDPTPSAGRCVLFPVDP